MRTVTFQLTEDEVGKLGQFGDFPDAVAAACRWFMANGGTARWPGPRGRFSRLWSCPLPQKMVEVKAMIPGELVSQLGDRQIDQGCVETAVTEFVRLVRPRADRRMPTAEPLRNHLAWTKFKDGSGPSCTAPVKDESTRGRNAWVFDMAREIQG
jgi:hypothetical protein